MKLLHIDSSIMADNSVTRILSAEMVDEIRSTNPDAAVTYYDLAVKPIAHLSGGLFAAQAAKPEDLSPEQKDDLGYSAKAMDDFLAADVIVIGAPMYNFSIPTQLKSWIDRIAVAGKTFRYTEKGPEGLAGGKRVIIVSSRGGFYGKDTPQAVADHQENYLRTVFGFLGIHDVEFVRAEGVAMGPDHRVKAMDAAKALIHQAS